MDEPNAGKGAKRGRDEGGGGPTSTNPNGSAAAGKPPDPQKARKEPGEAPTSTDPAGPKPAAGEKRNQDVAFGDRAKTGSPPATKKKKDLAAEDLTGTSKVPDFPNAAEFKRGGKTFDLIFTAGYEEIDKYLAQITKGSLDDKVGAILARGNFAQVSRIIEHESPKRLLESVLEKKYAYGKNEKGNAVSAKYTLYPIHLLILNSKLGDREVAHLTDKILDHGPVSLRRTTRLEVLVNATAKIPTAVKTKPTEKSTMQLAIESNMEGIAKLLFEGPPPTNREHRLYTLRMCVGKIKGHKENEIADYALSSGWYTPKEIGEECKWMVGVMAGKVSDLPTTADEGEVKREQKLENIAGTLGYCMANMDLSEPRKEEKLLEVTETLEAIKESLEEMERSEDLPATRPPGPGEEDHGIDDFSAELKQLRTDNATKVNYAQGELKLARSDYQDQVKAAKAFEVKSAARTKANEKVAKAKARLESAEEEYKTAVLKQNLFLALRLYGGLFAENTADDIIQPLMRTVTLSKYRKHVVEAFVKKALEGAFVSKCINPHEDSTGIPPQLWIVVGRMIANLDTDSGELLHDIIIDIMDMARELLPEAPRKPTTSSKVITFEFLQSPLGFRLMQAVIESGDRAIFEEFMKSGLEGVRMSQIYDPMETEERPGDVKTDEALAEAGLTVTRSAASKNGRSLAKIMNEEIEQAKSSTDEPKPNPNRSETETEPEDLVVEEGGTNQARDVDEVVVQETFVPRDRLLKTGTRDYNYPTEFPEVLFPEAGDTPSARADRAAKFAERVETLSADMWKQIEEEHAKEEEERTASLDAILAKAQKEKIMKDAILEKAQREGMDSLTPDEIAVLQG